MQTPVPLKPPSSGEQINEGAEFDEDDIDGDVAMINSVSCGPERLGPVAEAVRINREEDDENEFVALFNSEDLGIACGDTRLRCMGEGTLEDGAEFTFAGTSNEFKTVGRQCKGND